MAEPTLLDHKTLFLRTQILTLSQPLQATPAVLSAVTSPDAEHPLTRKAVDEAVFKANQKLRRHNRVVYAPAAVRHVGEQIERLYWGGSEELAGGGIERGIDLRDESVILELPEEWPEEEEVEADPEGAEKYRESREKLVAVNEKRRLVRGRLEAARRARALVAPFQESVQENLVVKDGDVERGLERMRMLMLRVERGLGGLEEGEEMDVDVGLGGEGEERMKALMREFA